MGKGIIEVHTKQKIKKADFKFLTELRIFKISWNFSAKQFQCLPNGR
jgi:hypothetical protein